MVSFSSEIFQKQMQQTFSLGTAPYFQTILPVYPFFNIFSEMLFHIGHRT